MIRLETALNVCSAYPVERANPLKGVVKFVFTLI